MNGKKLSMGELNAAMDQMKALHEVMAQMIAITCVVNLRPECGECLGKDILPQFPGWLQDVEDKGHPLNGIVTVEDEGFNVLDAKQFHRQCVIWAKEKSEEHLSEPCTMENSKELLREITKGTPLEGLV